MIITLTALPTSGFKWSTGGTAATPPVVTATITGKLIRPAEVMILHAVVT